MIWLEEQPEVIERCSGKCGELQLQRRGQEFEIIYNGVFLMATYNGASEKTAVWEALNLAAAHSEGPFKVLLGGLGVGYSLQQALAFRNVDCVVVAEIEPAVIRWNRTLLTRFNDDALNDPRVTIFEGDFRNLLEKEAAVASKEQACCYHLVMVDTDNGSSWLSLPTNNFFYNDGGLKLITDVLHPAGTVSFWCSRREELFEEKLGAFFTGISFKCVPEKTGQEGCYYLASRGNNFRP
jgi:spermidine synthase